MIWVWGISLLLLGHAFVHAVWRTYGPKTSWLLANVGESTLTSLSTILFVAAAIGFGLAGLGLLIHHGWWPPVAVVSALASLLLLVLFWSDNLFVGAAIDVAVVVAVLWAQWPPQILVGS
jgi:hypothetical protein